jgi:hypothetical protein
MTNKNTNAMNLIASIMKNSKSNVKSKFNEICQQLKNDNSFELTQELLSNHPIFDAIRNNNRLEETFDIMAFKIFHVEDIENVQGQLKNNLLDLEDGFYTDIIRFHKNRLSLEMLMMCMPTENPNVFMFKKSHDAKSMGILTFSKA